MTTKIKRGKTGFTLIEVMVVFLIFISLFDAIWMIYKSSISSNDIITESLNVQGEIRNAFTSMTAGIKSASQSSTGAYPISTASSTSLTYFSDIDHDGLKEQVRYFLLGTSLRQGIIKPTGNPLIYQVSNEKVSSLVRNVIRDNSKPVFSYYDSNYDGNSAPMTNPPNILNIRLIKINLLIDKDPNTSPAAAEFTTQISIRNLKDNL